MVRKKGKSVSFDAMVKFFMHNYDIPTKKDVDKLLAKLDRIENLIKTSMHTNNQNQKTAILDMNGKKTGQRNAPTALDQVYTVIKRNNTGLGISDIQDRTGFDKKKIRNIIYRLSKSGRIKSRQRGIYIAV